MCNIYELRSCPTPHLSSSPSTSIKSNSKCAKESKRAKECEVKGGRNACCTGLVCYRHQHLRCVQGKIYKHMMIITVY